MIEVYKFLTGVYSTDSEVTFKRRLESVTRGHSMKLYKQGFNKGLDVRKYSFGYRPTIDSWNSLPEAVIMSANINAFKNALDRLWISKCYDYTNEEIHACKRKVTERVHTGI